MVLLQLLFASADCGGSGDWAGDCCCSCCEAVMVGGEPDGAGVSPGDHSYGVSICW